MRFNFILSQNYEDCFPKYVQIFSRAPFQKWNSTCWEILSQQCNCTVFEEISDVQTATTKCSELYDSNPRSLEVQKNSLVRVSLESLRSFQMKTLNV